jgi:twitching motility two-component system response regulator PilH
MPRILLLDDSPTQALHLGRQLREFGHEVAAVVHLSDAQAAVVAGGIDLALVELNLLQDNGFDAGLSLLRAGVSQVLLMSGVWRETDDIWARALGLQGVLTRPITAPRLAARIAQLQGTTDSGIGAGYG